ncbi:MAG: serine/threonine-protein kinase PknK [Myxococcota bacterium]
MHPVALGSFSLLEVIARGGMAQVWRGVHRSLGIPVAVKLLEEPEQVGPAWIDSFRNEVRAVASLDHPHIIQIYECGRVPAPVAEASAGVLQSGQPYLVMEFASGRTLAHHRFSEPDGWQTLRVFLLQLLDALAHAHARGVIHLDLKPANVLLATALDHRPGLKLTDFGIAQVQHMGRSAGGAKQEPKTTLAGTLPYMAPEQFSGEWRDFGPWTDLYALGCLTYRLISGHPPFRSPELAQAMWDHRCVPPPPLQPRFAVPTGVERWIQCLLEKAPADRFRCAPSARAALLELSRALQAGKGPWPGDEPQQDEPQQDEPSFSLRSASVESLESPSTGRAVQAHLSAAGGTVPVRTEGVAQRPHALEPQPQAGQEDPPGAIAPLPGVGLSLFSLRPIALVGRTEERRRLRALLEQVRHTQRPALVLLEGPAGTGKSRLLRWLAEQALERGLATVLSAVHVPTVSSAEALPDMLLEHLRAKDLNREAVRGRVERELLRLGLEDAAEVEALTELLLPHPTPDAPAPATSEVEPAAVVRLASAQERYAVLRRHLLRLSVERPLMLCLEDVQWGADALCFIQSLLQLSRAQELPLLIVMTVQQEALPERPLEADLLEQLRPDCALMQVGPLSRQAQQRLLEARLGLEPSLARKVAAGTGGNPLFAVQLVGSWVEQGLLEPTPRGFQIRARTRLTLPDSIHHVWRTRVARLVEAQPADAPAVLELAAAFGSELRLDEWEALCRLAGLSSPVLLWERMRSQYLLVLVGGAASAPLEQQRWAFVHSMLRSTLERLARESGRWALHQRICATYLAQRPGPRGWQLLHRWGRHLLEAEAYEAALEPLLEAARESLDKIPPSETDQLLDLREHALDVLKRPPSDLRRGEGWLARAHVLAFRGKFDAAVLSLRRLEHAALEYGWSRLYPEAVLIRAQIAQVRDDPRQALEAVLEAQARFEVLGHHQKRAECVRLRGTCARALGRLDEAETLLNEALQLFVALQKVGAQAWCLTQLGRVMALRGEGELARRQFEHAYRLHREVGHQRGMASCLSDLAALLLETQPRESLPYFERSVRLFERADDVTGLARALNNQGEALRLLHEYQQAGVSYQRALSLYEAAGTPRAGGIRVNLALVRLRDGDAVQASVLLDQATPELQQLQEAVQYPAFYVARLLCATLQSRWLEWDLVMDAFERTLTSASLAPQDRWPLEEVVRQSKLKAQPERSARAAKLMDVISR